VRFLLPGRRHIANELPPALTRHDDGTGFPRSEPSFLALQDDEKTILRALCSLVRRSVFQRRSRRLIFVLIDFAVELERGVHLHVPQV
jgi:hypothetical protein